jgi:hypothetical protein
MWKGDITKERILDALGVSKNSLLYSFAVDVAGCLVPADYDVCTDRDDLWQLHEWCSEEEFLREYAEEIDALKCGWKYYQGYVSNEDGDGASGWLTYEKLDIETPDLIIRKEAGF